MAAVREHLAGCDDAHAELLELGEAGGRAARDREPAEPPAALKARLLAAAEADLDEGRHPSTPAAADRPRPEAAARRRPAAPVGTRASASTPRDRRRLRLALALAAAAVIVAVALGGWNIALRRDLSTAEAYRNGVDAGARPRGAAGERDRADRRPRRRRVRASASSAPTAPSSSRSGPAATPGRQVYTAWAIGARAPVSLGDFTVRRGRGGDHDRHRAHARRARSIALTLEPKPARTAPAGPVVASRG